jgi:hypothetical protein
MISNIIINPISLLQVDHTRIQLLAKRDFQYGAGGGLGRMLGVGLVILLNLRSVFPSLLFFLLYYRTFYVGRELKQELMGRGRRHRYACTQDE